MPVPLHEAKAALFRNIGHPIRIRVLELLCELEEMGEIGKGGTVAAVTVVR